MQMLITLKVLTDLYSDPDENGQTKLIKKDIENLKQFDSTKIMLDSNKSNKTIPRNMA